MGFRFRRSVRLFPGVRVNFSKTGLSVSAGAPGATLNFSSRGTMLTLGIPGTGLSYRTKLGNASNARSSTGHRENEADRGWESPLPSPQQAEPACGEIRSADVAELTSPDLLGLKTMIAEAAVQRKQLQTDFDSALRARKKAWRKLRRREQPPLSFFLKSSIPPAQAAFAEAESEASKVAEAISESEIKIAIELSADAWAAWSEIEAAHAAVRNSERVWDVTASVGVNRIKERTVASSAITRVPVSLSATSAETVPIDTKGLRFENANGGDLDIFPGLLFINAKNVSDYALIDLRDLSVETAVINFIEEAAVPSDALVVGHAWEKSNKDGTPDRRFNNNRQIPIVRYGELRFSTNTGINEAYQASDCDAVLAFGRAMNRFKSELRRQANDPNAVLTGRPPGSLDELERGITLPPLPRTPGAYEVLLVPTAAIAGALYLNSGDMLGFVKPIHDHQIQMSPEHQLKNSSSSPVASSSVVSPPKSDANVATQPHMSIGPIQPHPETSGIDQRRALPLPRAVIIRPANMRSAPTTTSSIVQVLPQGAEVDILGRQGSWVHTSVDTSEGWVHESLLRLAH